MTEHISFFVFFLGFALFVVLPRPLFNDNSTPPHFFPSPFRQQPQKMLPSSPLTVTTFLQPWNFPFTVQPCSCVEPVS